MHHEHGDTPFVYPYLLRAIVVERPNQVWATDITYIRIEQGFAYLVAVMGWHSRKVLAWRLSHTLDAKFYVEALQEALSCSVRLTTFGISRGSVYMLWSSHGENHHM
jgi:putative transposase